ncbi:hypothetical protein A4U53_030640 [Rhizobium ruizarguesonis]|uniref:Uncharacterized protein n=1 Tax=Rhizobium ruizarguesonis TaxID=2081791 RepID=A0ACD5EMA0_9HYPH
MTNTTGWNIWRGDGDCPVSKEAIVDIRLRSGRIIEVQPPAAICGRDRSAKWRATGSRKELRTAALSSRIAK